MQESFFVGVLDFVKEKKNRTIRSQEQKQEQRQLAGPHTSLLSVANEVVKQGWR